MHTVCFDKFGSVSYGIVLTAKFLSSQHHVPPPRHMKFTSRKHVFVTFFLIGTVSPAFSISSIVWMSPTNVTVPISGTPTTLTQSNVGTAITIQSVNVTLGNGSTAIMNVTAVVATGDTNIDRPELNFLGQQGQPQALASGVGYANDMIVGSVFNNGPSTSFHNRVDYTITFTNIISPNADAGFIYIEGINNVLATGETDANHGSAPPANTPSGINAINTLTFAKTNAAGFTPSIANWTQQGAVAPRGGNNATPTFNAAAGTLTINDSGHIAGGAGDSSGLLINVGNLNQYAEIKFTFSTVNADGFLFALGQIPEVSSTLLLSVLFSTIGFTSRYRSARRIA
jgi:hypothetical protein